MKQAKVHKILLWIWGFIAAGAVVSVILAWLNKVDPTKYVLLSVAFISFCSIYANMGMHWSALGSYKAKDAVDNNDSVHSS